MAGSGIFPATFIHWITPPDARMPSYQPISLEFLPLWLSFTLCLSITAGGVLVLFRFRQTRSVASYHYLQYFLILLYVYGYYSLWSAILLAGFMPTLGSVQSENIAWVATLLARMGTPFFVVSQLMLLIWAARLQQLPAWPVVLSAALVSSLLVSVYSVWGQPVHDSFRMACSVLALVSALCVSVLLLIGQQSIVSQHRRPLLIALVLAAGLIHLSLFTPLAGYHHFDSVFVLVFYLFNTAAVVIYSYHAAAKEPAQESVTLDDFLLEYGISKREADIVRGIYDGKTNQEIANQLFISLQTVKDHSSRIYQKTHVKNRAQLSTLVRDRQSRPIAAVTGVTR